MVLKRHYFHWIVSLIFCLLSFLLRKCCIKLVFNKRKHFVKFVKLHMKYHVQITNKHEHISST